MLDLIAVFVVGLLGSAHCVGMCGGFVALLGVGAPGPAAGRLAAYFAGKTSSYMALGAIAGLAGGLLRDVLAGAQGVLGIGLGVVLVAAGLALCGVAWGRSPLLARAAARLGPVIGRLVGSGGPGALVALGALNGLLPCGLVYGMLASAASSGSAGAGALTMGVFGAATVPALAVTGLLGARLRPERRLALQRVAGVLVVVMGLLTVVRGASALAPDRASPAPHAVCATPGSGTQP